jgi:hypothetical protein
MSRESNTAAGRQRHRHVAGEIDERNDLHVDDLSVDLERDAAQDRRDLVEQLVARFLFAQRS